MLNYRAKTKKASFVSAHGAFVCVNGNSVRIFLPGMPRFTAFRRFFGRNLVITFIIRLPLRIKKPDVSNIRLNAFLKRSDYRTRNIAFNRISLDEPPTISRNSPGSTTSFNSLSSIFSCSCVIANTTCRVSPGFREIR